MLHIIQQVWNFFAGSWLDNNAYNFITGPLADLSLLSMVGGISFLVKKHNCHAHGCWRIGKHPVKGTPYVTCKKHHPAVPAKVTAEHIEAAHKAAQ